MYRHKTLSITLRDLRVAKLNRRVRANPCTEELDTFLTAISIYGEGKVPIAVSKRLADCMDQVVSYTHCNMSGFLIRLSFSCISLALALLLFQVPKTKSATVQFHLSKFVKSD